MTTIEIVFAAVICVLSLVLIFLVMSQRSREESLGSAFGELGSGFEGEHGSSRDMKLAKYTRVVAILAFLVIIAANVVVFITSK